MRTNPAVSLRASLCRLVLIGVTFSLTALTTLVRSDAPSGESTVAMRPARNPERMHLLLDSAKVLGWISGVRDHAGANVTVTAAGIRQSVRITPGNTFVWPYEVTKGTEALFTYGQLRQSILLSPLGKEPPCVFFVVERGVHRPRQTLRFAGFLRDLDARGDFVPRPAQTVEVMLTSATKKTVVARLRQSADAQGRFTGEYTFADADPLDSYRLTIPDYRGEARITLADYRKSKVHLNISSRSEEGRVHVRFQGRDYLDKPVKGAHVQLVGQIVRQPAPPAAAGPLDGAQFAYTGDNGPPVLRLEDLTTEERVMAEADDGQEPVGGLNVGLTRKVIHQFQGKIDLDERGEAVYPVELRPKWLESGHVLVVRGVMIDADGREERRTKSIALTEADERLRLSLSQASYRSDQPIIVTAGTTDPAGLKGSLTLIATRLSAGAPPIPEALKVGLARLAPPVIMADWGTLRRTLATAVSFRGDTATLRLREPGAYILTALWHRPDGARVRRDIGCAVLPPTEVPALTLRLDRESYSCGDTLTGTIESRYADACVLLTLRDAVGLRRWKTLQLHRGRAEIRLGLPLGLHYGCALEAQYADADGEPAHVISRILHIIPADRMLSIQSKVKSIVKPGENVALDLQVNRKEPVDLIVSVYDQALRGLAPDRSPDVGNFYLADDRIHQEYVREVLRRRLGSMTLAELVQKARAALRERPDRALTVESAALQALANWSRRTELRTWEIAALLRAAGIRTRAVDGDHTWKRPDPASTRRMTVWEWLTTADDSGWRLHFALPGDTLLLTSYHPTQNPEPWHVRAAVYYPASAIRVLNGGFAGMSDPRGMGAIGGLGGIGGIAGLGGGGFNQLGANGGFQGHANLGVGGGIAGLGGLGLGMMGMAGMGGLNTSPSSLITGRRARDVTGPTALDVGDLFEMQVRRNFADAAYWNARLRTDEAGQARVEFQLPDSLTSWQVVVTAISKDMHVGRHETSFQTAKAIMVNPILPRFFTEGDRVRVSANVHNRTDSRQTIRVHLKADNGKVKEPAEKSVVIDAHGSTAVVWDFQAGDAGFAELQMSAESEAGADASLKRLPVVIAGVEHVLTASGFCKDGATISLPKGVDPSQVVFEVRIVPSLTADLLDTLPYLVDYPYGCVEQTMSKFLPAIKVAQILKQFRIENPELTKKLPSCVAAGIHRLLHLQHADGGWGWWENDATHEMMTPYALYGLLEADKAGYTIGSPKAIPAGLARLKRFIEQMRTKETSDRILCMYVYGQRHPLPEAWWIFIAEQQGAGKLSDYALALSLELAVQHKRPRLQADLVDGLRARAVRENSQAHWQTGGFSKWADDSFEVTAAALKALVAADRNDPLIPEVLAYFAATKRDNRWNSTKDTAMIIFALCDCLAHQSFDPFVRPSVAFHCNDGSAHTVSFAGLSEGRKVIVPAGQLRAGVNHLTFTGASPGMMYRIAVRYWLRGRNIAPQRNGIAVVRRWWLLDERGRRSRELGSGDIVPRGAYLESVIEARPTSPTPDLRYVLVENPRPAGCEVLPEDDARFNQKGTGHLLREDREKLVAFHHDQVPGALLDRCVLHAELPGEYLVAPAHVEMMYQTEVRGHSGTFAFRVAGE